MKLGPVPLLVAIFLGVILHLAPARANDDEEPQAADNLIHSDVPLFGDEADKWPQPIRGGDIGCTSRVAFGDWVLRTARAEADDYATWYRIENYGMIHCWALVSSGVSEREELDGADSKPSFFVMLEQVGAIELWALQMGGRPGSDYLLLSRNPAEELVTSFSVLQRQCPQSNVREGPSLDSLRTDYCAINSADELRQLARLMFGKEPLGTFSLAPDLQRSEGRRHEHSEQ